MSTATSFVGTAEASQPLRRVRLNTQTLLSLVGVHIALVALGVMLLWAILVPQAPLSQMADYQRVRAAVLERTSGQIVDPLIQLQHGVVAPASSLRGFAHNGVTYYYYIEGQQNFDPLSRSLVAPNQIHIVLRDTADSGALVIYTLMR